MLRGAARQASEEVPMPSVPTAKVLAPVGDEVVEAEAGASMVKPRGIPHAMWDALAHRYGLTIQNDWFEELERTYGVKL
jgi:hypothetical protein